jgi:predicted aspartyl protease
VKTPVVKVNDSTVDMIVDTGASTDILDEVTYGKVNHLKNIQLQPATK